MRAIPLVPTAIIFLLCFASGQVGLASWGDTFDNSSHVATSSNIEISSGSAHLAHLSTASFTRGQSVEIVTEPNIWNYTASVSVPMGFLTNKLSLNLTGEVVETSSKKPLDVVLVTDVSGSMGTTKMRAAKEADRIFVNTVLPDDTGQTQVGLVSYSSDAYLDSCLTDNKGALIDTINSYSSGGMTCIACGMEIAISLLEASPKENKVILLVTDGEANTVNKTTSSGTCDGIAVLNEVTGSSSGSAKSMSRKLAKVANEKGIVLYTIGFGSDADDALLQDMADSANGDYYYAPSAENLRDIYKAIAVKTSRSYPANVTINVGGTNESYTQLYLLGEVKSNVVNLTTQLSSLLALYKTCNCSHCSVNGNNCVIGIGIKSESGGTLHFSNLDLSGMAGSGGLASKVIRAGTPFGGWHELCYDAGNIDSNKDITIELFDEYGNHLLCSYCTIPINSLADNGMHCFDISNIVTSRTNITLNASLYSTDRTSSPELRYWNVSWINAVPPATDAGGPYICTTGETVVLDGSNTTDASYCPAGGGSCSSLNYTWSLTGLNSVWSDTFNGVKPSFTCPPVGSYSVSLSVTNPSNLKGVYNTYLQSNPTKPNLTIETTYVTGPSIVGIPTEITPTVKNTGMSKSQNYNISYSVLDENNNTIYQGKNVRVSGLPGDRKRKNSFKWTPDKPGKYTIQIQVLNETGGVVYADLKTTYVKKPEGTSFVAPEYPGASMLIVLLLVPLISYAFLRRKRE